MEIEAWFGPSTANQPKSNPAKLNVIKTMFLVCTFFVVSYLPESIYFLLVNLGFNLPLSGSVYLPESIYFLLVNLGFNLPLSGSVYYVATFFMFLFICTNPFIYAVKFNPVKRVLQQLWCCKKLSAQSAENAATTYTTIHVYPNPRT